MNIDLFTKQMIGNWIIQTTNYSSLKDLSINSTYKNKIKWIDIKDYRPYLHSLLPNLKQEYIIQNIKLYLIELADQNFVQYQYYALLLSDKYNNTFLLKFDVKFQLIIKFAIQDCAENYLSMISEINGLTIINKIYFLNTNLKVIKSIIKNHEKYMATSFSSEIRIS